MIEQNNLIILEALDFVVKNSDEIFQYLPLFPEYVKKLSKEESENLCFNMARKIRRFNLISFYMRREYSIIMYKDYIIATKKNDNKHKVLLSNKKLKNYIKELLNKNLLGENK